MNQFSLFLIKITPFYYGWIILLSSGIATIAACAAAALTLSVFVTPMANELGWSRTLIIGAPTIAGLIAITLAPISGWVIDRKGDKFVLSISLLIMGISLIFLNYWITPLSFYILFGIARLLFVAPIMNSGTTVVSRWFIRRRGRANGISILITSIGMGLIPVYSQFLIDTVGWREAWLWLGVTVWIIGAIPSLLFIISKPENFNINPDPINTTNEQYNDIETSGSWTLKESLSSPILWILCTNMLLLSFVHTSVNFHISALLVANGLQPMTAAFAITVLALGTGLGGLLWGIISEKMKSNIRGSLTAVFTGTGALTFLFADNTAMAFSAALIFGFGLGGTWTIALITLPNYFGRVAIGSIRGIGDLFMNAGMALGGLSSGIIYDLTQSYDLVFPLLTIIAVISAISLLFTKEPKK
tara:strand:+ start:3080 stop:4327 length:1248 start_codon:yes stop_codon:yes gene_type:complete